MATTIRPVVVTLRHDGEAQGTIDKLWAFIHCVTYFYDRDARIG